MKYGREFEKQADLLGAQIMARAGYDPRALARMFETIEKESKSGGSPEWLSSHPNPGNRTAYITKEAESLQIASRGDTGRFAAIKESFNALPRAKTMKEVTSRTNGEGRDAELRRHAGRARAEAVHAVQAAERRPLRDGRSQQLDQPVVEPVREGCAPERLRQLERTVRLHPRRRVRHHASRIARPPRRHRCVARRPSSRQPGPAHCRRPAVHADLAALGHCDAAREPFPTRRA